jgi:hypothetical protein
MQQGSMTNVRVHIGAQKMLDPTTDTNLTLLHRIMKEHKVPEFAKSASMNGLDEFPSSAFADPSKRKFPCNSRANTFVSYAYFLKSAADMRPRESQLLSDRFTKFADDWGIAQSLLTLRKEHEKLSSTRLEDLPDTDFGLSVEHPTPEGTAKIRTLPLLNATCVEKAAQHLVEYKDRYPYHYRRQIARNVLAKQAQYGGAIPDEYTAYLMKAAGYGFASYNDIAKAMWGRAMQVNDKHRGDDVQVNLVKVARELATLKGVPDQNILDQAVTAIDSFDRHFKLGREYHAGVPTPEEVTFGTLTEKAANDIKAAFVTTTTGKSYRTSDLASAGLNPFRVVGSDLADAVRTDFKTVDQQKVADIVPTLPRDDAMLLDRALAECGVKTAADIIDSLSLPSDPSKWGRKEWAKYQSYLNV